MKTMKSLILWGTFAVASLIAATGQQPDTAKDTKQPADQPASPPAKEGAQTPTPAPATARLNGEIGRASCRERV